MQMIDLLKVYWKFYCLINANALFTPFKSIILTCLLHYNINVRNQDQKLRLEINGSKRIRNRLRCGYKHPYSFVQFLHNHILGALERRFFLKVPSIS